MIGKISIALPPFKNEHYLCRVIFKRAIHQPIDWSLIYKEMTEDDEEITEKKNARMVQDAVYRLNERIKKEVNTDDGFFSWRNKSVIRNF